MQSSIVSSPSRTSSAPPTGRAVWIGRVVSAVPAAMMLLSAAIKLAHAPAFVAKWTGPFGFQESSLTPIGWLEAACVALYLFPRTSFFGTILVGCYLGGATCAHVRIGDGTGAMTPILLGVLAWLGMVLRDQRLRPVVWRSAGEASS